MRRLLIESAWHHPQVYFSASGPALRARWAKVDPALFGLEARRRNRRLDQAPRWPSRTRTREETHWSPTSPWPAKSPAGASLASDHAVAGIEYFRLAQVIGRRRSK